MGLPHFVYQWRNERDRLKIQVSSRDHTISSQKNQINEIEKKLAEKGKFYFRVKSSLTK